jgi:uncharacterized protein
MEKNHAGNFKLDWRISVLTISSTILLMVDYYFHLTPWKVLDRTILYLVIPVLLILFILRGRLFDYGFTFGNWKQGIKITLLSMIIMTPILWLVVSNNSNMQEYYRSQIGGLPWNTMADLFGWEFLFRGFLLFGYAKKYGSDAIWFQAVPFALAHIGKPGIETLSTIFGGFAFGWIAYRTRSFIYPFLIHWFIASLTILMAGISG